MMNEFDLPPLPGWMDNCFIHANQYSEHEHAGVWLKDLVTKHVIAAIEADRQARGNAVASAVSIEPDTEREKWLASLFPEDRMFEEIDQMARESYKRHHSSTRGQMLVRADSWDSHVVWATKRWIEENEPLPTAPQLQQQADSLCAVYLRDNSDGEGDMYWVLARIDENGKWVTDENGRPLLAYEGDAVLRVVPLGPAPQPAEPVKVPSDDDFIREIIGTSQFAPAEHYANVEKRVRALLTRYGSKS